MPKVEDDKLARQYLLGELSESEGAKVEEEFFEDDEAFERLNSVEDELIDAYTLGQLSPVERKRFEQRLLLSSAQHERVKFARTLLRTVSGTQKIVSDIPPLKRTASWWTAPFTFLRTLNPVVSLSTAALLILVILTVVGIFTITMIFAIIDIFAIFTIIGAVQSTYYVVTTHN